MRVNDYSTVYGYNAGRQLKKHGKIKMKLKIKIKAKYFFFQKVYVPAAVAAPKPAERISFFPRLRPAFQN